MHADPKNTLHVPDEWLAKFSFIKDSLLRRQYHAMVAYMDEVVGNVTTQLKTKGMWENVKETFRLDVFSTFSPTHSDFRILSADSNRLKQRQRWTDLRGG